MAWAPGIPEHAQFPVPGSNVGIDPFEVPLHQRALDTAVPGEKGGTAQQCRPDERIDIPIEDHREQGVGVAVEGAGRYPRQAFGYRIAEEGVDDLFGPAQQAHERREALLVARAAENIQAVEQQLLVLRRQTLPVRPLDQVGAQMLARFLAPRRTERDGAFREALRGGDLVDPGVDRPEIGHDPLTGQHLFELFPFYVSS